MSVPGIIYHIHRVTVPPPLDAAWNDPAWAAAEVAAIHRFYDVPQATDHRPAAATRMLYDDEHVYLQFQVHDRYVRAVKHGHQAMVCRDSCVEFFFTPTPHAGLTDAGLSYFNLETSCGGQQLLYHCRDHGEIEHYDPEAIDFIPISEAWMGRMKVWASLPERVEPEIIEPTTWRVGIALPLALIREQMGGELEVGPGVRWAGNFYKCGDETSHPHWASWSPVTAEPFRFHHPPSFGELVFG